VLGAYSGPVNPANTEASWFSEKTWDDERDYDLIASSVLNSVAALAVDNEETAEFYRGPPSGVPVFRADGRTSAAKRFVSPRGLELPSRCADEWECRS